MNPFHVPHGNPRGLDLGIEIAVEILALVWEPCKEAHAGKIGDGVDDLAGGLAARGGVAARVRFTLARQLIRDEQKESRPELRQRFREKQTP